MGSTSRICDSFWKRYFDGEENAQKQKIDIFELIYASITIASIEHPNEFQSRKLKIVQSLLEADRSIEKENEARRRAKNAEEPIVIRDITCKKGRDYYKSIQEEPGEFDTPIIPSAFASNSTKKRKAGYDDDHHSDVKQEKKIRRSFEDQENNNIGKSGVDSYEIKFEGSKTRFVERNQQIKKAKGKMQILKTAPRQKHWFGSRMKKILKEIRS